MRRFVRIFARTSVTLSLWLTGLEIATKWEFALGVYLCITAMAVTSLIITAIIWTVMEVME